MPSTAENKEIARRFIEECWNHGKLDAIAELVSKDCRYHDPAFPSLNSGAENIKQHISSCRSGFPDLTFTIDDQIAERNEVVVQWTAHGTHKAAFLGIAPTNRKATVTGTSISKVEGGKITEYWSHWNLMSLMEQLGVSGVAKTQAKADNKTRANQ
jgi:steroid delta-isomerase-like uncharacterized protein